ncbi:hypothetical protein [Bartonella grahamii]|nr:hypothetical protein [Bartonella grahamii]
MRNYGGREIAGAFRGEKLSAGFHWGGDLRKVQVGGTGGAGDLE